MNSADYRSSHTAAGSGHRYDLMFGPDHYDGWIWSREQLVLRAIVERHFNNREFRLLDFACGTGRILSFLEPFAKDATGVDVSADMLALARERVRRARFVQRDMTREGPLNGERFDLVTAFRFFLNADHHLRVAALAVLRELLKDGGLLVLNTHGNLWSLKLPSYLFRRWVLRQGINAISTRAVVRLLREGGFRVTQAFGVGWCSPRIFDVVGARWASKIEDLMQRVPILTRFATDLIYVCERVE